MLMKSEDVAAFLHVGVDDVDRLVEQQGLPAHELPGDLGVVFLRDEVVDWVRGRPAPGSRHGTASVEVDYDQPVWDSEQVAHVLRLNIDTVRRLSRDGEIPAHKLPEGRAYKYLRDEVLDWVANLERGDGSD